MDKRVTILVNSCDKYEDAWEPFFKLLKIHWPECGNYRIILNTETKVYDCDFLNVETICGGNKATWSQRLKFILEQIDTEFVLLFLEDFFLMSRVNIAAFNEAVDFISSDKSVGYVGLKYNQTHKFRDENVKEPQEHFFDRTLTDTVNRINCNTALWRKEFLLKLLREHESPWEFEKYGSYRSKRYNQKIMIINNMHGIMPVVFDYDVEIKYGHGLTLGQWLPKNKELFDEYGIEVDIDNLGVNYQIYNEAINPKPKEQVKQVQEFDLREELYNIKKRCKKQKKKFVKFIRKIKSLI